MMTLGIIVIYDLRQKIIPRAFLYLFLFLSLFPLVHHFLMTKNYVDLASPLFVALPYFILFLITMGRGVGFGDVLLYAGVGAILGTDRGVLAFLMSLWVGTLVVIPLLLFRFVKKESAIPFAPFIVCGYFIVLFTQYGISDLVTYVYRAMLTI
jgi:prepilin signal peptidase PulO-like enzyme (type II secretory pathway)